MRIGIGHLSHGGAKFSRAGSPERQCPQRRENLASQRNEQTYVNGHGVAALGRDAAAGGKANQYFIRGFNLDHGTDFQERLDGMPLNMPTHGHGQGQRSPD